MFIRSSNVGASTGRQLASHGLRVLLYLEEDSNIEQKSIEISLFKATGNTVVYSSNGGDDKFFNFYLHLHLYLIIFFFFSSALPTPDLVILSTNDSNLSIDVKKWLNENRYLFNNNFCC